jgi:2,3-bisphosphoglycerate-dependent phosphoglycerate mutase
MQFVTTKNDRSVHYSHDGLENDGGKQHMQPLSRKHYRDSKDHIQLIFLRHGQSTWNQQNIFIGMNDTPLTPDGVHEARVAGSVLAAENLHLDVVYTSLLRRATKTVWLVMQELGMEWVPVVKVFKIIMF